VNKTISTKLVSRRSRVTQAQAKLFAAAIRHLEDAFSIEFSEAYDPDSGDTERFWALPQYQFFHDTAYACGFVCTDFTSTYPLEKANAVVSETVGREPFTRLRLYVADALASGALQKVADRLESDRSLYDDE
jgi:hypothetical protein